MTSAAPSNSNLPKTESHKGAGRTPQRIRRMFSDIAPSYDFLNHVLSANRAGCTASTDRVACLTN